MIFTEIQKNNSNVPGSQDYWFNQLDFFSKDIKNYWKTL